jgi:hypothetical protein
MEVWIVTLFSVLFQVLNIPQSTYSLTGRCEKYKTGQYCDIWLNSNETVFVDPELSQARADTFIKILMGYAEQAKKGHEVCRQILDQAFCRYVYPNCTSDGTTIEVAQLCSNSCPRIEKCSGFILQLALDITATRPRLLFDYNAQHIEIYELQYSCRYATREISNPLPTPGPGVSCIDIGNETFSTTSAPTVDDVWTCGGTANANGSKCLFPFTYNGVDYNECTLVNSFSTWRPWCTTEKGGVGEDDKWGYCDCEANKTIAYHNATCEEYSAGPVCEPYLNRSTVFVDRNYRQQFFKFLMDQFNRSFYKSSEDRVCTALSLQSLCHLLFPECLQNNSSANHSLPRLFCHHSCSLLDSGNCGSQFRDNMKTVTNYFQSYELNPVHFYAGDSVCRRLPRQFINSAESCVEIPLPTLSITSPTTDGTNISEPFISASATKSSNSNDASGTTITVIVIIFVVLASVVFVFLFYLWRRKKKNSPQFLEGIHASTLMWDDDVANAIPDSLVDEKRLVLKEQIGEGKNSTI